MCCCKNFHPDGKNYWAKIRASKAIAEQVVDILVAVVIPLLQAFGPTILATKK